MDKDAHNAAAGVVLAALSGPASFAMAALPWAQLLTCIVGAISGCFAIRYYYVKSKASRQESD